MWASVYVFVHQGDRVTRQQGDRVAEWQGGGLGGGCCRGGSRAETLDGEGGGCVGDAGGSCAETCVMITKQQSWRKLCLEAVSATFKGLWQSRTSLKASPRFHVRWRPSPVGTHAVLGWQVDVIA